MLKQRILLTALLLTTVNCVAADKNLDQYITQQMAQYKIPGASIAIIDHGKIIYTKAYGYADIKAKREMSTSTMLQACSISKTVTSLATLLSFAKRDLTLDKPVNTYLTSWHIPSNQFSAKQAVTVRMLLDHSAGISNPYTYFSFSKKSDYPTNLQLMKGEKPAKNPELSAEYLPGSKYTYCNGCYVILQTLLVDVDKRPFPDIMHHLVLAPLGMNKSTFNPAYPYDHHNQIALPYAPGGKLYASLPFVDPKNKNHYVKADNGLGVGGLWTTPTDLAKFAIALQKSLNGAKKAYIPQSIAKEMVAPSSTPTRGLGFFIVDKYGAETKQGKYFLHSGFNQGYLAEFIAGKSNGKGAIIMVNASPDYHAKKVTQFDFIKHTERYIADQWQWK